jgi:tetratricopeptide (TPR) repeat protein
MSRTVEGTRLEGQRVAITGRLGSMTREEAVQQIEHAGGVYCDEADAATTLLVVGEGVGALDDDGRPTKKLEAVLALWKRGASIQILSETEFLERLGLEERLHRMYTTEQLARILRVPVATVRAWVRHGLIRPARSIGRLAWFEFQQVAQARDLCELASRGVSAARIKKSLEQVAAWTGRGEGALTLLESLGQGVFVRLGDGRLAEPTGQLVLGFEPEPAPLPPPPAPADASAWFERGVNAEDLGRLDEAVLAYRQAERAGGPRAEIAFNLGNVLYARGERASAAHCFQQAVRLEPDYVEAWNNLGNVASELGQVEQAAEAYRHALAIAPDYSDAHYNFAELCFSLGDLDLARRHFRTYLAQDPGSEWAAVVRGRLAELERAAAGGGGRVVSLEAARAARENSAD